MHLILHIFEVDIFFFPIISLDHPGFHYSPDGDKKDSSLTKDGPNPRRGRRKGRIFKTALHVNKYTS